MRVILAFLVLLGGIAAVVGNLAEPLRFHTDMTPLTGDQGRVGSFAQLGADRPAAVAAFQTTSVKAEQPIAQAPAALVPAADEASWASGTTSAIDQETQKSLARDIQSELARLGCYAGPIDGSWSPDAQRAASMFLTEANAKMAVDRPDFALFSLTKAASGEQACGPAITVAQAPAIVPPAMGLGGPGDKAAIKTPAYYSDHAVQSLFTNPLGR